MADPEVNSFIQRLFGEREPNKAAKKKTFGSQHQQLEQLEKENPRSEQPTKPGAIKSEKLGGKSLDEMTVDEILEMHRKGK